MESNNPLSRRRIHELATELDPTQTIDEDAEELLMQLADEFIENVVTASCRLAKHRKSSTLEMKDVRLHLEHSWNMWIPGFSGDNRIKSTTLPSVEAHKQRVNVIKKSKK